MKTLLTSIAAATVISIATPGWALRDMNDPNLNEVCYGIYEVALEAFWARQNGEQVTTVLAVYAATFQARMATDPELQRADELLPEYIDTLKLVFQTTTRNAWALPVYEWQEDADYMAELYATNAEFDCRTLWFAHLYREIEAINGEGLPEG